MAFDTTQFTAQIANLQGLDLLQYIGTHVYLISFIILFIVSLLTQIFFITFASERGRIRTSTAIIMVIVTSALSLIIMTLIWSGFIPWYTSRI